MAVCLRCSSGEVSGRRRYCAACRRQRANDAARRWKDRNPDALAAQRRRKNLERWGLSEDDFDALLRAQGGACAICRRPAATWERRLNVDHDHRTGEVRGLLCCGCNGASLGAFGDDPARVEAAIVRLEDRLDRLRAVRAYLAEPPARRVLA